MAGQYPVVYGPLSNDRMCPFLTDERG
jgi:hypothetical protein